MQNNFSFILGNGITRLQVDCDSLLSRGTVYGCNRIYQELAPDVLVTTDTPMSHEVQEKYQGIIYTRQQALLQGSNANVLPKPYHGWSSGPAALGLASDTQSTYLFLIGFDFKGVNNTHNNIYAGTANYRGKDETATYFGNWLNQIQAVLAKYPTKRVFHVNPLDNFTPAELDSYANFETMDLEVFLKMINNS